MVKRFVGDGLEKATRPGDVYRQSGHLFVLNEYLLPVQLPKVEFKVGENVNIPVCPFE